MNCQIVLVNRPDGAPRDSDFAIQTVPVPEPRQGELLIRAPYLSVDPLSDCG